MKQPNYNSSPRRLSALGPDHRQQGLSLVMVVIALAVFGTLGMALLTATSTVVRGSLHLEESNRAVALARSQVEFIKQQPYTEPPNYETVVPPEGFQIQISTKTLVPSYLQHVAVTVSYPRGSFTLEAYKVNRVAGVPPPGGQQEATPSS